MTCQVIDFKCLYLVVGTTLCLMETALCIRIGLINMALIQNYSYLLPNQCLAITYLHGQLVELVLNVLDGQCGTESISRTINYSYRLQ